MAETEKKVLKIGNFKLTILAIKKAFNCAAHTRTLSRVSKIPESFLAKKCDGLGILQSYIGTSILSFFLDFPLKFSFERH